MCFDVSSKSESRELNQYVKIINFNPIKRIEQDVNYLCNPEKT